MSVKILLPKQSNKNLGHEFSVLYGQERFSFNRETRNSKHERVLIKVKPDCQVIVKTPKHVSDDEMLTAVKKRSRWVHNQLKKFKQQQSDISPKEYVSGESHLYLGRNYLLKVQVRKHNSVKLLRGKLQVNINDKSPENVKASLNEWYRHHAKSYFEKRLTDLLKQTLWIKDRPPIRLHNMKTQWGSCSPSGKLTLNPSLIKAPRNCIDYVILHELCHIAEHNHSKRFYRLLNQVMPDWEDRKVKLDGLAMVILNE